MPRLIKLTLIFLLVFCYNTIDLVADRNVPVSFMNKAINGHYIQFSADKTLKWCADKCVYVSNCRSFGFNVNTKYCVLYSINSSEADRDGLLKDENNNIIMDVHQWIKGKTGGCWDRPCAQDTICEPHNRTPKCELYGCSRYNTPHHGLSDQGNKTFFRVGDRIGIGCEQGYFNEYLQKDVWWVLSCNPDGTFGTWTYGCYTQEELCKHYILETLSNRKEVNISIGGTPASQTEEKSILFSSKTAFSAATTTSVEVEFVTEKWIGGFATKGGRGNQWVTHIIVAYSTESACGNLTTVIGSNGGEKIFLANVDVNTTVTNYFEDLLFVKCIQLKLVTSHNAYTLRLELLECRAW